MREEPGGASRTAASGARAAFRRALLVLNAFVPGALAGTFLAGLLFFLNPLWPFEPAPVARVVGRYGTLLGLVSIAALLPWIWRRPARSRWVVPWSLVAVFSVAGGAAWIHAARFSLYLPPGINQRLIKAALWLSLAGLIAFYTLLAHVFRRRTLGLRSRIGLGILAALTVYAVFERREAFDPPPPIAPRPSSIESADRPRLLVVGVSSASLDVILPLAERGQLPFFGELLRSGAYGRLSSLEPTRSRPSWSTLVTGKLPFRHGVVAERVYPAGFVAPGAEFRLVPVGIGFEHWGLAGGALPQSGRGSLRSLPLWGIVERLGVEALPLGWPEGPSETRAPPDDDDEQGGGADVESPEDAPELAGDLDALRRAGRWLAAADASGPRLAFVYLPALEEVSKRTFGGFSAVQFEGRQDPASAAAARTLVGAYAQIDDRLGRLWNRLPEPRALVVVSPYGIRERASWERWLSLSPRTGALEGRIGGAPDGVFLLRGPGIQAGYFLSRPTVVDVVPTVLYSMGFPAALDFDGRVLTEAFTPDFLARRPLSFVPSYETTRGRTAD
jgi:hypothetical protein